jgi:hypothetical protein
VTASGLRTFKKAFRDLAHRATRRKKIADFARARLHAETAL